MIQKLPRIGIDPGCRSIKENIRSHIRGTSTIGTRGGDLKRPRVTLTCSSHSHPRWRYTRTRSHIQPTAGRYPRTKESLVSPHGPSSGLCFSSTLPDHSRSHPRFQWGSRLSSQNTTSSVWQVPNSTMTANGNDRSQRGCLGYHLSECAKSSGTWNAYAYCSLGDLGYSMSSLGGGVGWRSHSSSPQGTQAGMVCLDPSVSPV